VMKLLVVLVVALVGSVSSSSTGLVIKPRNASALVTWSSVVGWTVRSVSLQRRAMDLYRLHQQNSTRPMQRRWATGWGTRVQSWYDRMFLRRGSH
jgi:hypothetical protein